MKKVEVVLTGWMTASPVVGPKVTLGATYQCRCNMNGDGGNENHVMKRNKVNCLVPTARRYSVMWLITIVSVMRGLCVTNLPGYIIAAGSLFR